MATMTHSHHDLPIGPHASRATGPKSSEGKARSRLNACKHHLTGSVLTLPNEERAEYDARLADFVSALDPRDEVQHTLVAHAAFCSWRLDRIARQEATALSARVRQARNEFQRDRMRRVLDLGRRLMDDPVARCNADHNDRDDPKIVAWRLDEPLLLVMELAETLQGCDWLLDRWREISDVLDGEGFLHYDNKFKPIRLLGKRPETLLEDRLVGDIVLACRALHPENWEFEREAVMTCFGTENRPMYEKRVALLEARMPADLGAALNLLRALIDEERARLEALRAALEPIADLEFEESEIRASFDPGKESELRRRYEATYARQLHRALVDLKALQKSAGAASKCEEAPSSRPERAAEPPVSPNEPRSERSEPVARVEWGAIERPGAVVRRLDRPETPATS